MPTLPVIVKTTKKRKRAVKGNVLNLWSMDGSKKGFFHSADDIDDYPPNKMQKLDENDEDLSSEEDETATTHVLYFSRIFSAFF